MLRRLERYRRKLAHDWFLRRCDALRRRQQAIFDRWLEGLRRNPPEVLIGANFAECGGVRQHMAAISRYSRLRTQLVPPDDVVAAGINPHTLTTLFNDQFLAFVSSAIRIRHSHVFPWFTDWCFRQQSHGLPWFHTYHNMYFPEFAKDGILLQWQIDVNNSLLHVASQADVKISVSRWQQKYLDTNHGIQTVYLPNGVDVDACKAADASRFARRFCARNFVLYVGRNDPVKNPADFARLANRLKGIQFLMIGQQLNVHGLQGEWGVSVPDNLTVMGEMRHGDVLDAIAACSVLVVTSRREGLPTLVLEALALRKPVVVPDEAGCVEAIGNGDFGFVYKPGDIGDLAEKTLAACRATQTEAARERILREFDWKIVASRLDDLYNGR